MKATVSSSLTQLQRKELQEKEETVFMNGVVKIIKAVSALPFHKERNIVA